MINIVKTNNFDFHDLLYKFINTDSSPTDFFIVNFLDIDSKNAMFYFSYGKKIILINSVQVNAAKVKFTQQVLCRTIGIVEFIIYE